MSENARSVLRYLAFAALALALVAAVTFLLDGAPARFTDFWVAHPLGASLAAGALLLGIAAVTVDVARRREDERRRHVASRVATARLSSQCKETLRDMVRLVTGASFPDDTDAQSQTSQEVLACRRQLTATPSHCTIADATADLSVLTADPDWVRMCMHRVRDVREREDDALARWSGLMVSSKATLRQLEVFLAATRATEDFWHVLWTGAATCTGERRWHAPAAWQRDVLHAYERALGAHYQARDYLKKSKDSASVRQPDLAVIDRRWVPCAPSHDPPYLSEALLPDR